MTESNIQRAICSALTARRVWWRRNNTLRARGGKLRGGLGVGGPDLLVLVDGRALALEVKAEDGEQSDGQIEWQAEWEAAGGTYVVVRSVDEAMRAVDAMSGRRP